MSNILILFKREMKSYFVSPIAYVVAFIFLVLSGIFFIVFLRNNPVAEIGYMGQYIFIILFLCPILTIKLISEEKRSGTIELLLTSPISSLEIVVGKFLAAFALYAIILLTTLIYVLFLIIYSEAGPDYGMVFTGYVGLLLLGGSLIAVGIFTSSLTQSQVVAGIVGFGISLFFMVIDAIARNTGSLVGKILLELSLLAHFDNFFKGMLDTQHVLYYFLWITLSLLLAHKSVESHVWK